jgi:hypothetical protein
MEGGIRHPQKGSYKNGEGQGKQAARNYLSKPRLATQLQEEFHNSSAKIKSRFTRSSSRGRRREQTLEKLTCRTTLGFRAGGEREGGQLQMEVLCEGRDALKLLGGLFWRCRANVAYFVLCHTGPENGTDMATGGMGQAWDKGQRCSAQKLVQLIVPGLMTT